VFWDGRSIANLDHRPGFVDTVVELWGLEAYTAQGFYSPADGDVILDLGANIGLFSVWIARHAPGAKVFAIEPSGENHAAAERNLAGWARNVTLCRAAVGRSSGKGHLLTGGERTLDHRLALSASGTSEAVDIISLEQAVDLTKAEFIDLLKMDIEGGEVDALEGAPAPLLKRFRRIALEFHDNIRPGTRQRVQELLSSTHRIVAIDDGEYGVMRAQLRAGSA
jgi:FkbM family methyltransferase